MSSPFPGVDPYVEASGLWVGFHNALITYCSQLLNATLPSNYVSVIEERLELVEIAEDRSRQTRRADLGVIRTDSEDAGGGTATATATARLTEIEPTTVTLPSYEEVPEAYLDIISLPGRELVTTIEILSPSNKSKADDYLAKRAAILQRKINLVEIDLLLSGDRLPSQEPLPLGDFYAFVSRAVRRPKCEVYTWSIRRQLPKIPIPLKQGDSDVPLDLAEAFRLTYDGGRYDRTLQYGLPVPQSLAAEDRAWVAEVLATPTR